MGEKCLLLNLNGYIFFSNGRFLVGRFW